MNPESQQRFAKRDHEEEDGSARFKRSKPEAPLTRYQMTNLILLYGTLAVVLGNYIFSWLKAL